MAIQDSIDHGVRYALSVFDIAGARVCVAGSTGFLGSYIVQELVSRGAVVRGVSLNSPSGKAQNADLIGADLRNYESAVRVLVDQDALVIAAAVTSGAHVMATSPLTHLFDNTLINGALIRAAVEAGVRRVIFISSSTVYPEGSSAMRETDLDGTYFSKYEVVATMKKYAEDSLLLASRLSKTEGIVVRPGNAYGPMDHFDSETSHVIPALISKIARADSTIDVWGDGKDLKNFVFVRDLAAGIVQALEFGKAGEIYNLGGKGEISIDEVLRVLLRCSGKQYLGINYDTSKPSMIPVRRIDSSKAAAELGFDPSTGPEDGLCETYRWYVDTKS